MKYGLIGNPLSHSFSLDIHSRIGKYEYELCPLPPEELDGFMRRRDFLGINVTIPYKQAVIPYLDFIDEAAKKIGAVNTIINKDGKLFGYNTDFSGMRAQILRAGGDLSGKVVAILGTGGTSRTATAVAESLGAKEIFRVSRSGRDGAVTYDELYRRHADIGVIINTSPAGMYPNIYDVPVDIARFENLTFVFDAVFNPLRTRLVLDARKRGVTAEAGLYMLVYQGVCGGEYFSGEKIPSTAADEIFSSIVSARENIVLIGMASSGKSTVGQILSERLGRKLYDTDALVVGRAGMTVPEIFEKYGEARFRELERDAVKDVAKESGIIIATGGGVPMSDENVTCLRQNGRLYLLDRSPDLLTPTPDRPLSRNVDAMKRLWDERREKYFAAADETVSNNGTPQEAADIIERMHKR